MTPYAVIRAVAKALRYKNIPEIVGQQVVVHTVDTAAMDVLHGVGNLPPSTWTFISPDNQLGTIAKYGVLDLGFAQQSQPPLLTLPLVDIGRLRNFLNPLMDGDDVRNLLRDTGQHRLFLRLILESKDRCTPAEHEQLMRMAQIPPGFFPRAFIVTGANVSNADVGGTFHL